MTRKPAILLVLVLGGLRAQPSVSLDRALAEIAATQRFLQVAVSPDGTRVAYVEAGAAGKSAIYAASLGPASAARVRITAGDGKAMYDEHAVAWSPDSKQLAFLSDRAKKGQYQLCVVARGGRRRPASDAPLRVARGTAMVSGRQAHRHPVHRESATRARGRWMPCRRVRRVLESKIYEQRLAVVDAAAGAARQISPADQ